MTLPEPADAEVAVYDVLGTQVGATTEGREDGPAILLVPGVPGTTRDYRYLAPLLAPYARVHRLDLPGYGVVRDARWHDYTPDGRARLVVAAADALGAQRFAVTGHSMGGPAAIATAAMVPHRVTALVALASVGVHRHKAMVIPPPVIGAMRPTLRVPLVRDLVLSRSRQMYRRMRFPTADTLTRRDLEVDTAIIAGIDFRQIRRRAAAVRAETLVAFAEDDRLVEPAIGTELASIIEGAETAVYDEGGHNIQKTQAPDLARRILDLLEAE